jgi:N-acetylglucosamine kinase-like BadF-type ATPase
VPPLHRGSGHHIASRGLAFAARAADGRGDHPNTRLLPDMLAHLGLSTPEELIPWAYSDGPAPAWDKIASCAPVVLAAAEAGDEAASWVVDEAVEVGWHLSRYFASKTPTDGSQQWSV